MLLKKFLPYRTEITKTSFKKYEGFYYEAFVQATIIVNLIILIPIVSSGSYLGVIIPICISLIAYSNFYFTEIDFKNKRYIEAYYFLGNQYGEEWKEIPKMKHLMLVYVTKYYEIIDSEDLQKVDAGLSSESHYELRIIIENRKNIVLLEFNTYKKAIEQSKIIAKGLNEELIDLSKKK